jgi:outer membrane protein assembly factor BamB
MLPAGRTHATMRCASLVSRSTALAVFTLLLAATAAEAVITKLTPLAEVLESDQYIFVAKADKLDPDNKDRPTATFKLDKKLKGEPPFERLPVNMTGDDEGKKAGDTKTIFERLDTARQLVFFVRKQGKIYNAKVFVEGSWFSIYGTLDDDGKTVRWAFLHGEPFLRRTFKGTSAEMVKTIEDALAKKAKPPEPDEKEKPGYGPAVAKEPKKCEEASGDATQQGAPPACHPRSPALFGVIPSFVLVGPLALIAALFPGVFARMAVGMKRWRAFLVVASINSTLAIVYWAVLLRYFPQWMPSGRWLAPETVTVYLLAIATAGMVWSGRRYRRLAAEDPAITGTPSKTELYALAGLTLFIAICTAVTALVSERWSATVELPFRELTFIGIALVAATVYAVYRTLTRASDALPTGAPPPVRLSLSGESVGLGVLVLCGLSTILLAGARFGPGASGTETGDAEATFGPRLVGEPVALEAFDVEGGKNVPEGGRVWSGLTVDGERLYFGMDTGGGGAGSGRILGVNRHTGKIEWAFDAVGMQKVFCTPTVSGGRVYCGEGEHENTGCRMFCANVSDGNSAWKEPFKTASHTEGSPALANGKVYFPAGDDGLYCCDAATGAKLGQFPGGKDKGIHIDAAPAIANGTVYVGSGLYTYVAVAIDANTMTEKWRTDLKLRAFGAPTVSGSKVFYAIGTGNMGADTYHYPEEGDAKEKEAAGAVVCLDAATGKEEWRYPLPRSVHTGVAADAFSVYVGCRDGFVYTLDRKSGKLRWKTGIGGAVLSCPAVATSGGFPVAVYAVSQEGLMVCLNPQTGTVHWQKALPGFRWDGRPENGVMCSPVIVTTPTATGSARTIYVGAMTVDPQNSAKKTVAVFKFEDVIGE